MANRQFKHLEVALWRQFDSVSIDFHPRLTVITGANGSGKSTLLNILGRNFGWARPFLTVPTSKNGTLVYLSGLWDDLRRRFQFRTKDPHSIGYIDYTDNKRCTLSLSGNLQGIGGPASQIALHLLDAQEVLGLYIDSHRPNPGYSHVISVPLQPMTASQSFDAYNGEMQSRFQNAQFGGAGPIFRMKESIISMAIFGEGNAALGGSNRTILDTFLGFNEVLRKLLPTDLGFRKIEVRTPEVVLVTDSGDFMLDASSGGLITLIDIAWRIFLFSKDKMEFVVLMDEPENHLHPSMQRTLMKRLISAFPAAQFIIATHSPFMVSSVRDSAVYVLRYKEEPNAPSADVPLAVKRRVYSQPLPLANKAGTANEILREVLGVPATVPEWVSEELELIISRYKGRHITSELLDALRRELTDLGFDEYYPDALGEIARPQ